MSGPWNISPLRKGIRSFRSVGIGADQLIIRRADDPFVPEGRAWRLRDNVVSVTAEEVRAIGASAKGFDHLKPRTLFAHGRRALRLGWLAMREPWE